MHHQPANRQTSGEENVQGHFLKAEKGAEGYEQKSTKPLLLDVGVRLL